MKVLVDMNLSPLWVGALQDGGHHAVHWSTLGSGGAPGREILMWAQTRGHVVLTNDLDFTAILAGSGRRAPSVVQLRMQACYPPRPPAPCSALLCSSRASWSAARS